MTKEIPVLSKYFSDMGKKGGRARADELSAKRRKEIATKAAKKRWAKARKAASDGK
ncbi:MAG: hypothetical protein ACM3WP_24005 [Acidobacteriota bacterium]